MLNDLIIDSPMFGIVVTLLFFRLSTMLFKRWPWPIFNPLFFTMISIVFFLVLADIPYATYDRGGQYFSLWVTPATVALAIRIEKNFAFLKRYYRLILIGSGIGILFHTILAFILGLLFNFNYELIASVFPKSITTAIAMDVSQSIGGIVPLPVGLVLITGIFVGVIGPSIIKLFNITDPVAQGIALGTAAHAVGTSKAIELGDVQAAMASLSIAVAGLTVVGLSPVVLPMMGLFF